jgi:hypothetical protein
MPAMNLKLQIPVIDSSRYARCIEASKRIHWDIEDDVIRGRRFDFSQRFSPEVPARRSALAFLKDQEQRLLNQNQGCTNANMFGLLERFIGVKMLEMSRHHGLGDQVALEALLRFGEEELKHQALFRRIEAMVAVGMPGSYRFTAEPNSVARVVLAASTWAVLARTCRIELFTQVHYRRRSRSTQSWMYSSGGASMRASPRRSAMRQWTT